MRILLVEDEAPIATVVQKGLERAHYTVDVARDGDEALRLTSENSYALILLDLMLPRRDGWSVCQTLRARRDRTPIIMLTARDAVPDRVKGLEMGADDYLPKPFDFQELLARVRAQIRRDAHQRAGVLHFRDVEIDTAARRVMRGDTEVALTPREYSLFEALATNEGRVLTREHILERVWLDEGTTGSNTVDVYINLLRRKIDAGAEHRLIQTVHGVGYVLRRPDAADEPALVATGTDGE
jgi:two-component system copper resistance phosphate regulon response regulator CusR